MHAADDDSVRVPHGPLFGSRADSRASFNSRAPLFASHATPRAEPEAPPAIDAPASTRRRTAFLLFLIALGGAYGALMLAGRLSPSLAALLSGPGMSANDQLKLPLLAQLASLFAGLAALVLVLSRALREIDARPYLAIAPVIAAFCALVHAGLRVDLSSLGVSSALAAVGALSVALLGGAFISRDDPRARIWGWGLVLAPGAWLAIVVMVAKGQQALEPAERAYMLGLFVSTLVLGGAGMLVRRLRAIDELPSADGRVPARFDALQAGGDFSRAKTADFSRVQTEIGPAYKRGREVSYKRPRRSSLASRWRSGGARMAGMLVAVAVAAYLAVGGLRNRGSSTQSSAAEGSLSPSVAPVVEQLDTRGNAKAGATPAARRKEHADKPRGNKASFAASAPSRRAAPVQTKAAPVSRAKRSTPTTEKVALPAWGAEAMREFDSSKASKASVPVGKSSKALVSKSANGNVTPAAPLLGSKQVASANKAGLGVAAKPMAPAKPAPPPPPSKPLTMDQLLNRVEDAAKAQKKKAGAGAPKTKRDSELDDLINQAVQSKKK